MTLAARNLSDLDAVLNEKLLDLRNVILCAFLLLSADLFPKRATPDENSPIMSQRHRVKE